MKIFSSIIILIGIIVLTSCSYKPITPMSQASKKHTAVSRSHVAPSGTKSN